MGVCGCVWVCVCVCVLCVCARVCVYLPISVVEGAIDHQLVVLHSKGRDQHMAGRQEEKIFGQALRHLHGKGARDEALSGDAMAFVVDDARKDLIPWDVVEELG